VKQFLEVAVKQRDRASKAIFILFDAVNRYNFCFYSIFTQKPISTFAKFSLNFSLLLKKPTQQQKSTPLNLPYF